MKAVVIGAGSIGAMKAEETPNGARYMTHAQAIKDSPFDLSFIMDKDHDAMEAAHAKWGCPCGNVIPPDADVYVIATPPDTHLEMAREVASFNSTKGVVIEKPVGKSLPECLQIMKILGEHKICAVVNYQRRYDGILNYIRQTNYMDYRQFDIEFSGDFEYAGCHALDLRNMFHERPRLVRNEEVRSLDVVINGHRLPRDLDKALPYLYLELNHYIEKKEHPEATVITNAMYPHIFRGDLDHVEEIYNGPSVVLTGKDSLIGGNPAKGKSGRGHGFITKGE